MGCSAKLHRITFPTHCTSTTIATVLQHEEERHIDDLTQRQGIQAKAHSAHVEEPPVLFIIDAPIYTCKLQAPSA